MKLAKFLELSEKETLQQTQIIRLKNVRDAILLGEEIRNYDIEVLFKLAIINPDIDLICKSPELSDFWTDLWRQCGTNPREQAERNNEPVQEYLPMVTVPSCFDLLKGLYIYEEYRRLLEKEEMSVELCATAEEYLALSARCGCFFALNALCINGLDLLKSNFDESLAGKIISYAQLAAKFYLSPGYLLLSTVYQELSVYSANDFFAGQNLVLQSVQALGVAKRLHPISGPMLQNAYQGQTMGQASHGKIKNFFQAQIRLQKLFQLTYADMNIALEKAKSEANSIESLYSKAQNSVIDDLNNNNSEWAAESAWDIHDVKLAIA